MTQDFLRQIADLDQMPLQRLYVNVAGRDSDFDGHGRGDPGGISLVLQVGLHPDESHGIAMGADTESRHEQSVDPFRQQTAVRGVRSAARRTLAGRNVEQGKVRMHRVSVGIVIARREDDGVGKSPPGGLIENA